MGNFGRVVRLSLKHRLTVAASVLCAVGIAVLWASNIAVVMPIVDGVMHNKSIPELLEDWIESTEERIAGFDAEIATLRAEAAAEADPAEVQQLEARIAGLQQQRANRQSWLKAYKRVLPTTQRYLPVTPFGTLVAICLALLLSTIVKSMFRIAGMYFMARLGHLTSFELRKTFYRNTLQLDMGTFRQTMPGDLMNRFTGDIASIALGTQVLFGMAIREPLKMIACVIGAALISWQLLLMCVLAAPPAVYAIHWLAKALKRANRRALQELSTVYDHLEETFGGIKVIKAFTMESHERSRFHHTSKQYYRRSMKIAFYDSLVSPVTETMGVGMIVLVIIAGGYLVLNGQTHIFNIRVSEEPLTHGMLTAFYGMLAGIIDPVRRLSAVFNHLQRASASADRVYELLDRKSTLVEAENPVQLPQRIHQIDFDDVVFSYNDHETVLDGVSLKVTAGETIAVVGPNGCGKSTLMNLLARFYDPRQGAVKIDNLDLREVRLQDLRSRFGVVTQETLLFDDTIANNIRYGSPGATQQQIEAAARQAHAHRFITTKLTDGYQTKCGSGGSNLSGGQRQRIALARAILRNPEILILDEATSQIDVESERTIHEVLESFVQDRTAFMITHRPSTLSLADRIVVMDHGKIVDVGSFVELSARCELFRRLAHIKLRDTA